LTRLLLVRHGETQWNSDAVYRGRADIPLSAKGALQAERLASRLAAEGVSCLATSPLSRARDTAAAIARATGVHARPEDGLTDIDCGEWEGLSDIRVKELYPELRQQWHSAPQEVTLPGGESLRDVEERVKVVLDAVTGNDGTLVLVTHRVVLKVAFCRLLGLGNSHFWDVRFDLAGITEFECTPGRAVLVRHNDVSHLREEEEVGAGRDF